MGIDAAILGGKMSTTLYAKTTYSREEILLSLGRVAFTVSGSRVLLINFIKDDIIEVEYDSDNSRLPIFISIINSIPFIDNLRKTKLMKLVR